MTALFEIIFYLLIASGLLTIGRMVLDVINYFLDRKVERLQAENRRLKQQKGEI